MRSPVDRSIVSDVLSRARWLSAAVLVAGLLGGCADASQTRLVLPSLGDRWLDAQPGMAEGDSYLSPAIISLCREGSDDLDPRITGVRFRDHRGISVGDWGVYDPEVVATGDGTARRLSDTGWGPGSDTVSVDCGPEVPASRLVFEVIMGREDPSIGEVVVITYEVDGVEYEGEANLVHVLCSDLARCDTVDRGGHPTDGTGQTCGLHENRCQTAGMSDDQPALHAGQAESPLLEFDPAPTAYIEPGQVVRARDVPQACVLTWFRDAAERAVEQAGGRTILEVGWEDGPRPLYEVEHRGRRVAIAPMPVGGAAAAGTLEEWIALGCRTFVACGGAGVLRPDIALGHLVVVTSALRDEGTSHHYLPSGRVLDADGDAVEVLAATLDEHGMAFVRGRTWTTDAPYRETVAKIAARKQEGCVTVEMENASVAAVARFRGVPLAQVLYGGDDLTGDAWDHRDWTNQDQIRDELIRVAADAALRLADR